MDKSTQMIVKRELYSIIQYQDKYQDTMLRRWMKQSNLSFRARQEYDIIGLQLCITMHDYRLAHLYITYHSVHDKTYCGINSVHLAMMHKQYGILDMMLHAYSSCKVAVCNDNDDQPIHVACRTGDKELIARTTIPFPKYNKLGYLPVHELVISSACSSSVLNYYLQIHPKAVHATTIPQDNTCLHLTCEQALSLSVLRVLVQHGARINYENANNELAIHYALLWDNNEATINYLLDMGSYSPSSLQCTPVYFTETPLCIT